MKERIFYILASDKGYDNYVHAACVGDFMHEAAMVYEKFVVKLVTSPAAIDTNEKCGWCQNELFPEGRP